MTMNSSNLIEIEALERAFERDEDLMLATNYLAAFRATVEGRAFIATHMKHMDRQYARYEAICRQGACRSMTNRSRA